MMRSLRGLALVHAVTNALLLWLGYYWLGLGEGRASTLGWSAFVALVAMLLLCWTYGSALVFFRDNAGRRTGVAWRAALRNLPPLAIAALAVAAVYYLLARWADYSPTPTARVASYLTLTFRKPVKPASILRAFNIVLWLVRWVILPVLLLPMLSEIAGRGWRGFRAFGAFTRKWLFWIEAPLLLLCALALPLKLVTWVPEVGGFGWQSASFVLRAGAAYLFFVTAWLLLAFITSAGKPRFTQDKTAVSP